MANPSSRIALGISSRGFYFDSNERRAIIGDIDFTLPMHLYDLYQTLHLLCAVIFAGAVFFEVLVIEPLEKRLPPGIAATLAEEIPRRVRVFMPVIVGILFLTGIGMFWIRYSAYTGPWHSDFFRTSFGILLSIKVSLALIVLGVFTYSIRASFKGTMDLCQFRYTHRIVATIMLGIIFLAKGMYYIHF